MKKNLNRTNLYQYFHGHLITDNNFKLETWFIHLYIK